MRNRDYYLALEYGIAMRELSEAEGAKIGQHLDIFFDTRLK